jgi:hypothetical protein
VTTVNARRRANMLNTPSTVILSGTPAKNLGQGSRAFPLPEILRGVPLRMTGLHEANI